MIDSTNKNFKICANYYNSDGEKTDVNTNGDIVISSNNPTHINATISGGTSFSSTSCLSLEYTGNEYDTNENSVGGIKIGEGFNCIFRTDSIFEENEGYNGCIGFAWTKNSFGSETTPENAYGSNFSNQARIEHPGNQFGIWSANFSEDDVQGITLTLYPETTKVDSNGNTIPTIHQLTTKISHYVLNFKRANGTTWHIEDYLTECIDVYYENSLSVEHSFGKYNFYLNGKLFASIDEDYTDIDMWGADDGYFTAAFFSAANLDACLEIINISYCPDVTNTTNNEEENSDESI